MGLGGLKVVLNEGAIVSGLGTSQTEIRFKFVGDDFYEVDPKGDVVVPIIGQVDQGGMVRIRRSAAHMFEAVPVASAAPAYCGADFEPDPFALSMA